MLSFQSLFLFTFLAISTFALDQCPQDVQTIDVLDSEKVLAQLLRTKQRVTIFKVGFFQYLGNWYTVYGNINFVTEEGDNCIRATYKSLSK